MRYFLMIGACLWLAVAPPSLGAKPEQPHIILVLVDDVGYADIGPFGAEGIKTPHLDRMAAEGVKLTDFYVHPVCGVTRAALMTGCYAMRVAEVGNRKHGHPVLHPDEITLAEVMQGAGYATALIGKWHLGGPDQRALPPKHLLPNAQGFDYWFGTPTHNGHTREIAAFRTQLVRDGERIDDRVDQKEMDLLTQRYTDEAIAWIRAHHDSPFFLMLAHNMAHVVLGATDERRGTSQRGLYGDAIHELDVSVGRVLATLRELGIAENTLVLFTSDNGPWVEQHLAGKTPADDHYGRTGPLRGYKMTTWEGGVRVPTIAWWPGRVPAGRTCAEPAAIIDLMPTFAALAGAEPPADRVIDGRDIRPLLLGEPGAKSPHEAIYHYCFVHLQAVRSGKWKLVVPRPAKPKWCLWSARMTDAVPETALFDLQADLSETTNVADDHPEVVARLERLIERARADIGDYDRIGSSARFFDEGPKRPDAERWAAKESSNPSPE